MVQLVESLTSHRAQVIGVLDYRFPLCRASGPNNRRGKLNGVVNEWFTDVS